MKLSFGVVFLLVFVTGGCDSLDCPVEDVSWNDVQEFLERLNHIAGGPYYRLPTEAEWKYAARAGSETKYSYGDDPAILKHYAWYRVNAEVHPHPVGNKIPNPWGLYDIHGNVYELVYDRYSETYFRESPPFDPTGPYSGPHRVIVGGSFYDKALFLRTAYRNGFRPENRSEGIGFRILRVY